MITITGSSEYISYSQKSDEEELKNFYHKNLMITFSVITLSSFHCSPVSLRMYDQTKLDFGTKELKFYNKFWLENPLITNTNKQISSEIL